MKVFSSTCLLSVFLGANILAQATKTPEHAEQDFKTRLAETFEPFERKRLALIDNYLKKITERLVQFQASKDLDNALKATEEISFLKENGNLSEQEFPAISAYRNIFQTEFQAIERQKFTVEIRLRGDFIKGLSKLQDDHVAKGELKAAKSFANQIQTHESRIDLLRNLMVNKPVMDSFEIVSGDAANKILSRFHPRNSLSERSKVTTSGSWEDRPVTMMIRNRRPDSFSEIPKPDFWALEESTGWIELNWADSVPATTILLVNRPGDSEAVWVKANVRLNSHEIVEIESFGRMTIAVIKLKEPINLHRLRIEISEGINYPGLYSLEVYR